ncbi:MAG TPA: c-type cytochrome domain-containing protein [Polyangia bacterium]|nr:c-type cytochrome domain-containing protein [Polyangia bacterium]
MTIAFVLGAPALSPAAPAPAPAPPAPAVPSFAEDVAPILDRWCVSCHGPDEAQAGLRLDSYEAAMKGGDDGPVIVAGDPAASQLVAQIERRVRPPMPPKKRLPRDPIAVIRHWIATGAQP